MTTYILYGGDTKPDTADTRLFFKQFTDLVPKDHVKILLCYFAREKSKWSRMFEKNKAQIIAQSSKTTDIQMVDAPEDLRNKLNDADVLYVEGGEEENLRPYVEQLSFLENTLLDKVYIGSSMGAFLASRHYVLSLDGQNTGHVFDGLGLVPYNTLCHWDIEKYKDKKIQMLKDIDPQTPILQIEEQKFKIIRQ